MVSLVSCDDERLHLNLADLLSLTDAQLLAGALALRPLDQEHVEQLVGSKQEHWPPILVTRCDRGYLVIDGYHRWQAARLKHAELIVASCQTYPDARAVVDAAFRANLTHGLKASVSTRGDYAYWLHVTFPKFPQHKIAERVGLSQGAVSKAITRREQAEHKARQGQQDVPTDQQEACQPARQAAKRLLKVAGQFLHEVEGLSDEAVRELLAPEDRAKLDRLARLLEPAPAEPVRLRQFLPPRPLRAQMSNADDPDHAAVSG